MNLPARCPLQTASGNNGQSQKFDRLRKEGHQMFRTLFDGILDARLDEMSIMEREQLRSRKQMRK